jgi:small conductance mechanosensitive channel
MDGALSFGKIAGLVAGKVLGWFTVTVKMLPNLVVALIVLVIIWLLSIPVANSVRNGVQRLTRRRQIAKLLSRIARLAFMALGIILALDVLNLDKAVASVLAGVGILGFAITFASQDIAANFMAGFLLTFIRPFRVGDLIRSKDFFGYVEEIEMRSTIGRSLQGEQVILPNKGVLANPILNYSAFDGPSVDLKGSVAYKNNLKFVEETAIGAVTSLELRNPDRPVDFFYEEFGGSVINFTIRFGSINPDLKTYIKARSEAIKAIKQAFDDHEISMTS